MSRLDARWPLATAPWCPGTGGYGVHACRRVAIYDAAISAALAPSRSREGACAAALALTAIASQPESERVAIRAVLNGVRVAVHLGALAVGAALAHAHEALAHDAVCHDPSCLRRTRRARA